MDKDQQNQQQLDNNESQQNTEIKKININNYFEKINKGLKFIDFQNTINFVKQKFKVKTELNKSRYTKASFQPKIKVQWKPAKESRNFLNIMPFNKKSSLIQFYTKYTFASGFQSALSINSRRQGNLKFSYSNKFKQINCKGDIELQRKKDLIYKWGIQFKRKFVHQIWPNYLSAYQSQLQFKYRDWKPEVKAVTMMQTLQQYKFFTQFKVLKNKNYQTKANFQFQFPNGKYAINTEMKKIFNDEKNVKNYYNMRCLFNNRKGIKTGFSVDQSRKFEIFYQQDKIYRLYNSDIFIGLNDKNGLLKVSGKKGKFRYQMGIQLKCYELSVNLIGFRVSYNIDYNSERSK